MTSRLVRLSSPLVGSSRRRILGFVTKAEPIVTRRFCPPEMPRCTALPMRLFATSIRPSSDIVVSTRSRISCWDSGGSKLPETRICQLRRQMGPGLMTRTYLSRAAKLMVSRTERTLSRASLCSTYAPNERMLKSSFPSTVIWRNPFSWGISSSLPYTHSSVGWFDPF